MKTAEKWNNILHRADMIAWKEIITKIQLDAAKSALELAAGEACRIKQEHNADMSEWEMGTGALNCEMAILSLATDPNLLEKLNK